MRRALIALAALGILASSIPSLAAHCTEHSTSVPELAVNGWYYVDNDVCQPGCIANVWIYQETNSIVGLQRKDTAVDDTCHDKVKPDTIIF